MVGAWRSIKAHGAISLLVVIVLSACGDGAFHNNNPTDKPTQISAFSVTSTLKDTNGKDYVTACVDSGQSNDGEFQLNWDLSSSNPYHATVTFSLDQELSQEDIQILDLSCGSDSTQFACEDKVNLRCIFTDIKDKIVDVLDTAGDPIYYTSCNPDTETCETIEGLDGRPLTIKSCNPSTDSNCFKRQRVRKPCISGGDYPEDREQALWGISCGRHGNVDFSFVLDSVTEYPQQAFLLFEACNGAGTSCQNRVSQALEFGIDNFSSTIVNATLLGSGTPVNGREQIIATFQDGQFALNWQVTSTDPYTMHFYVSDNDSRVGDDGDVEFLTLQCGTDISQYQCGTSGNFSCAYNEQNQVTCQPVNGVNPVTTLSNISSPQDAYIIYQVCGAAASGTGCTTSAFPVTFRFN